MTQHHCVPQRWANTQTGLSLIELMIAIVMALFLSMGLLFIFVSMQRAFKAQNQIAQLQDNERIAFSIMSSVIEGAGYFVNPSTTTIATALGPTVVNYANGVTRAMVAGQYVVAPDSVVGSSDSITVRFQAAPGQGPINCDGTSNPAGNPAGNVAYTNTFSVANNQLMCSVNNGPPVTIADNIANLQVFYGLAMDAAQTPGVSGSFRYYEDATNTNAHASWPNVKTVKVQITFLDTTQSTPANQVALSKPMVQVIHLGSAQ